MAVNPALFKNEIYMLDPNSSSDSRWDSLENDHASYMSRTMGQTLFEDLGIDTSRHQPEKDSKGNLILYQMDADGKISNPFEDGEGIDSFSFLEKVSRGEIFAYPAGMNDPVQLQINYNENPPKIAYSKPMTENLYPKPQPLRFWTRFKSFFGGAKEEVKKYNEALKRYEASNSVKEATESSRTKEVLEQEKKQYEETLEQNKAAEAERLRREKEERLKADAGNFKSKVDRSMDLMQDIYGPKPVKKEEQIGCQYTNTQFAHLKPYETGDIQIKGKPLTDRQFMGVALAAVYTPECGGSVRSYKELSPEENMATNSTFYTSDLYAWGKSGRAGVGQYFKQAQGPAREKAYQALQEYKNGNKEPLGTLIGNGLHFSANKIEHYDVESDAYVTPNAALAQTVSLLDQDPDLKEFAKKAGMTEDDLNIARADLEVSKLYRTNEWADGRLEEDAKAKEGNPDARTLSEEEKKFCIDAKLKYQSLNQAVKLHKVERESSVEYATGIEAVMAEREPVDKEHKKNYRAYNNGQIPEEEFEKIKADYNKKIDIVNIKAKNFETGTIGIPNELKGLGTAAAKGKQEELLNKLVDVNLPNKGLLYGLDSKELTKELDIKKLFGKGSPYMPAPAIKEVPKVDVPVKKPQQAEKTAQKESVPGGPVV